MNVSTAPVSSVPIERIVIGERRREKLGHVKRLAASIETHGLIHPILLRGLTLVAGHRRLEACRSLGWSRIPARQVEQMTDDALRAIELDENVQREGLSDYAMSSRRLAEIRAVEAELKAQAEQSDSRLDEKRESRKRGGQRRPASKRAIAEVTGVSPAGQVQIEKHVAIAERYPFMQRPGWLLHHVIEAGPMLDAMSDRDRVPAAALLDQEGVPPKKALTMLANLKALPAVDRAEIFRLAKSDDPHERTTAATRAAAVPDPVDPALLLVGEAADVMRRAARHCRTTELRPQVQTLAASVAQLHRDLQETNSHGRRAIPECH